MRPVAMRQPDNTTDAALDLFDLGMWVFPLQPMGKRPAIESWARFQNERMSDGDVSQWWHEAPTANIAVITGPAPGILVLDVDGEVGREALAALEAKHAPLPATWRSFTGRGEHIWFNYPKGRDIGNSAGKLGAGLDTRGRGGYIVGPGSMHETGVKYRWHVQPADVARADAPQWLLDLIDPPKPAVRLEYRAKEASADRYVQRAVDAECTAVLQAPEGQRNDRLNEAAFSLGQFVGAGLLSEQSVKSMLLRSAIGCGLDDGEAIATIASGLRAGAAAPRQIPERQAPQRPAQAAGPRHGGQSESPGPEAEPEAPEADRGGISLTCSSEIVLETSPDYLLKGLIHKGDISMLYGPSGCGKTFFALHMAHAIASNRSILGRRVRPARVALFALEGSAGLNKRIVAMRNKYGDAPDLYVYKRPVCLFNEPGTLAGVIAAVQACGAELVIFDTLSRTMPGANENAPEAMTAMVGAFDTLRAATGAHVMLVHHAGKDTERGARGHSSLKAAVDVELELAKNDDGSRSLRISKGRDDADGRVDHFMLKSVDLGRDSDGDPITTCIVEMLDEAPVRTTKRGRPNVVVPLVQGWIADEIDACGETGHVAGKPEKSAISIEHIYFVAAAKKRWVDKKTTNKKVSDALEIMQNDKTVMNSNGWLWLP